MRKILSILLAISLIISMLPIAFADGETTETSHVETYKFKGDTTGNIPLIKTESDEATYTTGITIGETEYYLNSTYYRDYGERGWAFFDSTDDVLTKAATSSTYLRLQSEGYLQMNAITNIQTAVAISLQAPSKYGFYFPILDWGCGSKNQTIDSLYMDVLSTQSDIDDIIDEKNKIELYHPGTTTYDFTDTGKSAIYATPEDEIAVAVKGVKSKAYKYYSITLTQILPTTMTTTVDKVSLDLTDTDTINDTATASTTVSGKTVVDSTETTITDMPVSNNFITYKSSDEKVATVDANGTITAVGGGTTTVWAETPDGAVASDPVTVTVTAPEIVEPEEGLSGVTVVYDISGARDSLSDKYGTTNGSVAFSGKGFGAFSYAETDGFFEYAANSTSLSYPAGNTGVFQVRGTDDTGRNGIQINEPGNWIAFKIKVPVSGKYKPKATYWKFTKTEEAYMDYFLIKDTGEEVTVLLSDESLTTGSEGYIGSKATYGSTASSAQEFIFDEAFEENIELDAGEYYLVYKLRVVGEEGNAVASNFTLDGGTGSAPMFSFKSSADEITADKTTATVTASAKLSNPTPSATTGNRTYTFSDAPLTDIAYSVAEDDAEVAEVTANGVVSGKSYGVATINASAKYGEETLSDSLEISVVTPPVLDKEITYEENTHIGGEAAVTTYKFVENTPELIETKSDITLGSAVKVSAAETIEKDGATYTFLYWAKGATMAKKQIVSELAEFNYLPSEGANYLIAVYEPETESTVIKVEFYNGNGQLLPNVTLVDEKYLPAYPSMAGYGTAYGWALKNADGTYTEYSAGDDVSKLTGNLMFAAMYGEKEDITVFVDGTARTVKYGDTVTCTPDTSKGTLMYWMKNGSVVSLNDTYSFLAWEDCRVEAVYGTNKPELSAAKEMRKIILDRFAAGEETAIMAEFIGFEDAVEKGIMFGSQKIAMSSNSSQFTVLDDATTANTAHAYAIIPDGTGYKILTDGIANIGVDEEEILNARRSAAESYMRKMTSVLWSPSEDLTYTVGSTSTYTFDLKADRIYQGIPYAYTTGSYETFAEFAKDSDDDGVYEVSGLTSDALTGGSGISRIGNDCSGAVVRAWSVFGANIQAKTTRYMNEKYGFLKVGDYELLESDYDYKTRGTNAIVEANGEDKMFAAYAELQKADAVVHYDEGGWGHAMMVVSVDKENKTVTILEQTKAHYGETATKEIGGVGTVYKICGVDEVYTFQQLYNSGYLPITCRELREANYIADEATFRDTLGEESYTLRNIFRGTIHSTKAIDTVKVEILNGSEVVQDARASVARANIFAFDMQQFVTDKAAAIRGTGINTDSLESGEYTCKVTVYLTADAEGTTIRNFTFTK